MRQEYGTALGHWALLLPVHGLGSVRPNVVKVHCAKFCPFNDSDLSNRLSCNGCNDWVQLNRSPEIQCGRGQQKEEQSNIRDKDSEGEDSNDRHTVDDFE